MASAKWKSLDEATEAKQAASLNALLDEADAVVFGIGAGMSAATGFTYVGDRFEKNFPDFIEKYGYFDMLQMSVDELEDPAEYWACHSRFTLLNYYDQPLGKAYADLLAIIREKDLNAHIITTNADNAFEIAGYDLERVFHIQGQYNLMQCSAMCHQKTYEDEALMREMADKQADMQVPEDLIPHCPLCGAHLEINKRSEAKGMVEDANFHAEAARYLSFLDSIRDQKVLFLEIGIGHTTPQFVRQPFQNEVRGNPQALYAVMNQKFYRVPHDIRPQTVQFDQDIEAMFDQIRA